MFFPHFHQRCPISKYTQRAAKANMECEPVFHILPIQYYSLISDKENQECLWIIEAPNKEKIQISWIYSHSDCPATSSHVYIYDGLPPFVSRDGDSQTLGVFCLGTHSLTQTTKVSNTLPFLLARSSQLLKGLLSNTQEGVHAMYYVKLSHLTLDKIL